ncbi:hypothetical protein F4780DRAFT_472672 [Xylariomycetidae sp. FL0641]|nr:hypothetical protein F4780DRAFT_472672 [Xylariomycetidae sp. FL0641]
MASLTSPHAVQRKIRWLKHLGFSDDTRKTRPGVVVPFCGRLRASPPPLRLGCHHHLLVVAAGPTKQPTNQATRVAAQGSGSRREEGGRTDETTPGRRHGNFCLLLVYHSHVILNAEIIHNKSVTAYVILQEYAKTVTRLRTGFRVRCGKGLASMGWGWIARTGKKRLCRRSWSDAEEGFDHSPGFPPMDTAYHVPGKVTIASWSRAIFPVFWDLFALGRKRPAGRTV